MPSNPSDLRAVGDAMQSALSRLAEYVEAADDLGDFALPYEVRMAVAEAKSAVDDWTALRRQDAVRSALTEAKRGVTEASERQAEAVRVARATGMTWEQIAGLLGESKATIHRRYAGDNA